MSSHLSSPDQTGSMLKGLYWKETRQIVPLIAILVGVAFVLMLIWSLFSSTSSFAYSGLYIPLILPALYAAGVGAILIGQEKEQKTLWWLASLPAPASRLITVKFVVGLVGLVVMWISSWLLLLFFNQVDAVPGTTSQPFDLRFNYGFLHLHSVFILVCGFYSAWRLRNTFASLIAIIALSSVPLVLTQLGYAVRRQLTGIRKIDVDGTAIANSWVTLVAIVVVGCLAYRAARRSLQPAEPEKLPLDGQTDWRDAWRPAAVKYAGSEPFRYSISSLVWQSIHHNRAALVGIAAMLGVGVLSLALCSYTSADDSLGWFMAVGVIVAVFGVSWLGVFVFTGDGSPERIRFLAERGASPTQVWLGRQLIGVSLLSVALLLFAGMSLWLLSVKADRNVLVPSVALITIIGGVAYSVSQLTSQLLRILAASAFVAPVLAAVTVYWFGYAAEALDTPLWVLVLCAVLPMAATWLLMQRYMDGHRGLVTWLTAVVTVLLMVVVPVAPLLIDVARVPRVPASVRAKLVVDAKEVARSTAVSQRITLVDRSDDRDMSELSGARALQIFEQRTFRPGDRLDFPSGDVDASAPTTIDYYIVMEAIALATYDKLKLEASPENDAAIESLGQWIAALTKMATKLRNSRHWWDQNVADVIEIWLTQTLSSESLQPLLDRDFSRAAINLVTDTQSRNQSRRRAIVAAAHKSFAMARFRSHVPSRTAPSIKQTLTRDQEETAIALAAMQLIDAGKNGRPTDAARRELHELLVGPSIEFEDGPYSDRMLVGADGVLPIHQPTSMYPCRHWFGPWETDALRLAETRNTDLETPNVSQRNQVRETP